MGAETDKTPDLLGTRDQSLKLWPEQGGVGRLHSRLERAAPPQQPLPDFLIPTLLLTVKKPVFPRSLRPEPRTYIWGEPSLSQAQSKAREGKSTLTHIPIVQAMKQNQGNRGSPPSAKDRGQDSNPRLSGFKAWAHSTLPWCLPERGRVLPS